MEGESSFLYPKIPEKICSIKFFLILDDYGKRIYCNYYTNEYKTIESQIDFEKHLCETCIKFMVDKYDLDIINYNNYNILCKINPEVSFFIGQEEDDNELLLEKVYNIFENHLFDIVGESLTREKVLNNYDKIILLIDEMINGGIVLNISKDSLNNIILEEKLENNHKNENNKDSNTNTNNTNFISNWLGFFGGKK